MSISDRLSGTPKKKANRGCLTCKWLETLSEDDRQAIDNWLNNGWSMRQLHTVLFTDPENPIPVGLTAYRNHLQDCL